LIKREESVNGIDILPNELLDFIEEREGKWLKL
jgi:hypothetical protein